MLQVNTATPLYAQLQIAIHNDIVNGTYPLGARMPSETELGVHYGISRITVRRAVQELEKEGLLERKQGKGTFVRHQKIENKMDAIMGFTDSISKMGGKVGRVIHSKKLIPATKWLASMLQIPCGAQLFELKRTMYSDDAPILYDECYYPCSRFPDMIHQVQEDVSTYRLIKEVYGVSMPRAHKRFNVEIADITSSRYLGCEPGAPLFSIFKITYDDKNVPVQISKSLVLASCATYVLDVDERVSSSTLHMQFKDSKWENK